MIVADWVRLARWREWAQSKLPYLGAAALLLSSPSWGPLLAIIATICLWAAFGYGLNEVADRRSDEDAGRPNRAAGLRAANWALFLALTGGGAFSLSLVWGADAAAQAFVLAGLALAFAYSVPPARLKGRGAWGLIAAAAAQWALPVLAVSAARPAGWLEPAAWSLALLGLAIGMRWMAVHQRQDTAADRSSGVRTYAARVGNVDRALLGAFASEVVLLPATLVLAWPRSAPAAAALALWVLPELTLIRWRRGPLRVRLRHFEDAPLATYYFLLLPVALAISRVPWSPRDAGVVALFLALGSPYLHRMIRGWRPRPGLETPQTRPG